MTVLNAVNRILTVTCKSDKAVFLRDFCWQTDTTGCLVSLHACTHRVVILIRLASYCRFQVPGTEENNWCTLLVHVPRLYATFWHSDLKPNSIYTCQDIMAFCFTTSSCLRSMYKPSLKLNVRFGRPSSSCRDIFQTAYSKAVVAPNKALWCMAISQWGSTRQHTEIIR